MARRSRARHKKKSRKGKIIFGLILILLIGGVAGYFVLNPDKVPEKIIPVSTPAPKPKLKVVDEDSKTRPFGLMIDNNSAARNNHTGLQDAFVTYEILAEGGITRMFALFKDKDTSEIGPVRSSRHYFLDYALEHDAIYGHYGWSDRAKNDISSLGIDNLNGITNGASAYARNTSLVAPHNVFTSIDKLKAAAEARNYELESDNGLVLPYSVKEVDYSKDENVINATNVSIPYSYYHTTSYTYNSEDKQYYRSMNGQIHKDRLTGMQYYVRNIIILNVRNYTFDSYGRQDLENIGTGTGYYISSGKAIPINWSKSSRGAKTIYTKMDGSELKVNDGITAIQIIPIDKQATIS